MRVVLAGMPGLLEIQKFMRPKSTAMLLRIRRLLIIASVLVSTYYLISSLIFRLELDDMRRIDFRYQQFREAMTAERYDEAYAIMSPAFRHEQPLEFFIERFSSLYLHPLYPHRYLSIRLDTATLMPEYDRFGPFWQSSLVIEWEKLSGEWYLTGEINMVLD